MLSDEFSQKMHANNIRFSLLPIEKLSLLKKEIENTLDNVIEDKKLSKYISYAYNFNVANDFPQAKSIIIAAKFNPAHQIRLISNGKTHNITIPPGYINFRSKQIALEKSVNDILTPAGYKIKRIILPVKLLAVQSGLAEYGRNNIAYIPEFGSYHFLASFLSDFPADNHIPSESKYMAECEICRLCTKTCPSGAISKSRFLIKAERCLTLFNRNDGQFPDFIDNDWHNSLFGCMKCQERCPANADIPDKMHFLDSFDEDESHQLLNKPYQNYSENLKTIIDKWGMPELVHLIQRNLNAIIKNSY